MAAALVFMPALLYGALLAHLIWPERRPAVLAFKLFLGIGVGLGLRSILYFIYLLLLPGRGLYVYLDLGILTLVAVVAAIRERRHRVAFRGAFNIPSLVGPQRLLVLLGSVIVAISLLSTANYLLRRRQGDWDAWMMYNRAARFIYIDQAHWLESFSSQMDPIFHADYPLLLAANISAGWDLLGHEAASVPMMQSALFSLGCLGLAVSSLVILKSIGQAALGAILLWGVPVFVNEGARQMADVPTAYFLLATATLFLLHSKKGNSPVLLLAGVTAGLAAWTKNEGSVFVLGATLAALLLSRRGRGWAPLLAFAAGLVLPLAAVLYFKLAIAPSGDILSAAATGSFLQILDPARHAVILAYLWSEFLRFGSWGLPGLGFGIFPVLVFYYLVFRTPVPRESVSAFVATAVMIFIQLLGYYGAYLVSPYELSWHLSYSSTRVVLQIFPLVCLIVLCSTRPAEEVLASPSAV